MLSLVAPLVLSLSWLASPVYSFNDAARPIVALHKRQASSAPAGTSGFNHFGCVEKYNINNTDLMPQFGNMNSAADCLAQCKAGGYRYCGLWGGSGCSGTQSLPFVPVASTQCDNVCPDGKTFCGGNSAYNLYANYALTATPTCDTYETIKSDAAGHKLCMTGTITSASSYTLFGCVAQQTGDSGQSMMNIDLDATDSAAACLAKCQQAGLRYCGLWGGYPNRCVGTRSFALIPVAADGTCTNQCSDTKTFCGGYPYYPNPGSILLYANYAPTATPTCDKYEGITTDGSGHKLCTMGTVATSSLGYSSLGCYTFYDEAGRTQLVPQFGNMVSADDCLQQCKDGGYKYCGFWNAIGCSGSASLAFLPTAATDCNNACSDTTAFCGGYPSIQVFGNYAATATPTCEASQSVQTIDSAGHKACIIGFTESGYGYQKMGCVGAYPGGDIYQPQLFTFASLDYSIQSAASCLQQCQQAGLRYCGITGGRSCYGSQDLPFVPDASTSCSTPCFDGNSFCGGDSSYILYATYAPTATPTCEAYATVQTDSSGHKLCLAGTIAKSSDGLYNRVGCVVPYDGNGNSFTSYIATSLQAADFNHPDECFALCKQAGVRYCGFFNGGGCMGSNSLIALPPSSQECSFYCHDGSSYCGGNGLTTLFASYTLTTAPTCDPSETLSKNSQGQWFCITGTLAAGSTYTVKSCLADSTSSGYFLPLDLGTIQSADACLALCLQQNLAWCGLSNGNQCRGGKTTVGSPTGASSTACNSPCPDTKSYCGGPSLVRLYAKGAATTTVATTTTTIKAISSSSSSSPISSSKSSSTTPLSSSSSSKSSSSTTASPKTTGVSSSTTTFVTSTKPTTSSTVSTTKTTTSSPGPSPTTTSSTTTVKSSSTTGSPSSSSSRSSSTSVVTSSTSTSPRVTTASSTTVKTSSSTTSLSTLKSSTTGSPTSSPSKSSTSTTVSPSSSPSRSSTSSSFTTVRPTTASSSTSSTTKSSTISTSSSTTTSRVSSSSSTSRSSSSPTPSPTSSSTRSSTTTTTTTTTAIPAPSIVQYFTTLPDGTQESNTSKFTPGYCANLKGVGSVPLLYQTASGGSCGCSTPGQTVPSTASACPGGTSAACIAQTSRSGSAVIQNAQCTRCSGSTFSGSDDCSTLATFDLAYAPYCQGGTSLFAINSNTCTCSTDAQLAQAGVTNRLACSPKANAVSTCSAYINTNGKNDGTDYNSAGCSFVCLPGYKLADNGESCIVAPTTASSTTVSSTKTSSTAVSSSTTSSKATSSTTTSASATTTSAGPSAVSTPITSLPDGIDKIVVTQITTSWCAHLNGAGSVAALINTPDNSCTCYVPGTTEKYYPTATINKCASNACTNTERRTGSGGATITTPACDSGCVGANCGAVNAYDDWSLNVCPDGQNLYAFQYHCGCYPPDQANGYTLCPPIANGVPTCASEYHISSSDYQTVVGTSLCAFKCNSGFKVSTDGKSCVSTVTTTSSTRTTSSLPSSTTTTRGSSITTLSSPTSTSKTASSTTTSPGSCATATVTVTQTVSVSYCPATTTLRRRR